MKLLTNRIERARSLAELEREVAKAIHQSRTSLTDMAIRQAEYEARRRIERQARKKRVNRKYRNAQRALCVAVYDCNQAFGGPEEGGWWYDTGTLVSREGIYFNRDKAYAAVRALSEWCERNNEAEQRRPISSVLCEGVLQAHLMDYPAPAGFPTQRPHYE